MKATISELWETGRQIITYDDSDTNRPASVSDLKKCGNVLVGSRVEGPRSPYEILLDNDIIQVMPVKVQHPSGGGTMCILEVY